MNKVILLIFIFSFNCSIVDIKSSSKSNLKIEKIKEDYYKIILMNGWIYIGSKELSQGIFKKSEQSNPLYGITSKRGVFKFINEKPEWCSSGNCIDGIGESYYSNDLIKDYGFKFKGTFKNLEEFKGKIDYEDKTCFDLIEGRLIEKPYFSILIKEKEKEELSDLNYRREQKRIELEEQRNDLIQFINKMFNIGAKDYFSCVRLCTKYNITYNCNSKCQDAMNINR